MWCDGDRQSWQLWRRMWERTVDHTFIAVTRQKIWLVQQMDAILNHTESLSVGGCYSAFAGHWAFIPLSLWRMANATSNLRLLSQVQSVAASDWYQIITLFIISQAHVTACERLVQSCYVTAFAIDVDPMHNLLIASTLMLPSHYISTNSKVGRGNSDWMTWHNGLAVIYCPATDWQRAEIHFDSLFIESPMHALACKAHKKNSNLVQIHVDSSESESESECKCLNQKPTGSQFSLLHEPN